MLAVIGAGMTGALGIGCELLIQLDRSAVTVEEAGCPICSDVTEEGNDSGADSEATEIGVDAGSGDAGTQEQ